MNTIYIILCRVHKSDRTVGMLFNTDGLALKTIELPWKDNKPNISCIPDGIYPYVSDFSNNKGRDVLELRDVPNRSQIQIHAATKPEHVLGCIGCGSLAQEHDFYNSVPKRGFIHIKTIEI